MESISDKVAIIGMGCTKFGENWEKSTQDMLVEAAYEAFDDAGIDPQKDLQAAWFGNVWSGGTGLVLARTLQLPYLPVTRVENLCATGSEALRNACYAVAAGVYDIVLAIGVEKLKDGGYGGLPPITAPMATGDVQHSYRSSTFTSPGRFAMMATRYFERYGLSPEKGKEMIARIAVKNHYNGNLAPKAHFHREITLEQAVNAPIVAWPLGLFDCCGVSDGAAAAIICRADVAENFRSDPVYIKALQICAGPYEGELSQKYDFTHVEETYIAGQRAYAEAGIKDPRREINIAEVHDCFTITEAVIYEDLQFSPRGGAKDDIEAGTFELNGELPVNTDGGLKCFGHPMGATGLRMMYEVYLQMQGKAGPRQVKDAKVGLTHCLGGVPGGGIISVLIAGAERD